jgi:hypothetical protein
MWHVNKLDRRQEGERVGRGVLGLHLWERNGVRGQGSVPERWTEDNKQAESEGQRSRESTGRHQGRADDKAPILHAARPTHHRSQPRSPIGDVYPSHCIGAVVRVRRFRSQSGNISFHSEWKQNAGCVKSGLPAFWMMRRFFSNQAIIECKEAVFR